MTHPWRWLAVASASAVLTLTPSLQGLAPQETTRWSGDPHALAEAIEARYDRIADFSATFTHTYEGGLLRKRTTEHGEVQIKKPGRMRWHYTRPEEKLFVSDGATLYAYVPADRQVVVSPLPEGENASTPVLFLLGRGSLVRDFTPSFTELDGAPPDTLALKLVPVRTEPEYEWLALAVDRTSLSLRMLVTADAQGGTSAFTFARMEENAGLADRLFRFTIPRGTDVIRQ